jgi:phosphocarrier protein HPr
VMKDAAIKDETAAEQVTDRAELINTVGLHARPSVKLTQLAKTFECCVEIALLADGPWVDAKSPVKVMRVKAPRGAVLHVRASGKGARAAAAALVGLVREGFGETMDQPDQSHG